jgi:cell division protein FtsW
MKSQNIDKILLATVMALSVFGLIIISSASVVLSYSKFGYNYYYLFHQFFYGFLPGIALLLLLQKIDYRVFKKHALLFLVLTVVLLLLVFIPNLGYEAKGANRWIAIGNFTFQPSEFAKLTFILYLAAWFEKKKKHFRNFSSGLLPFVAVIAVVSILLIKQPDIGTLVVTVMTATVMYFVAGARLSHMLVLAAGGIVGILALIKAAPYRMDRLMVFLHPELDPQGIGYQINQAILALGSGGILGLGLGHSRQKFNYLPEPIGDSIFAIAGEELGMVGLIIILVLFLIFALRGFKIASRASDNFGKLVAVGITSWIILQAFTNIAAIISLIPLTGIPLPFISYGGSSLIALMAGVGILLSISRGPRRL